MSRIKDITDAILRGDETFIGLPLPKKQKTGTTTQQISYAKQLAKVFNEKHFRRDVIPVCTVHNKFQTENGRWLDSGFEQSNLRKHAVFACTEDYDELESPCDECEGTVDVNQLEITFEHIKQDYTGFMGNNSGDG